MASKLSFLLIWVLKTQLIANLSFSAPTQHAQSASLPEVTDDPLSYALHYARKSNNQSALSRIAVHYAELGNFEQAIRVNEAVSDEDWRTGAFGEIALAYWKQGKKEKARQLFLRVAGLPLPKDVIYIWGDIIENMAEAQQFDLALDTVAEMAAAEATTADSALQEVVEEFVKAKASNPNLTDILPRVVVIARSFGDSNDEPGVLKKVAVAYTARGDFDRATKLTRRFKDEYDIEDGAYEVSIQLAKLGLYDRALALAATAGDYFGPMALEKIAIEALKRRDAKRALEIAQQADSLIAKLMKDDDADLHAIGSQRMAELAVLYSQLDRKSRSVELADLAFKTARRVGKPGDRYDALRSAANTYCELGLYDKAIDATKSLGDYERVQFDAIAEVGVHAQRKGRLDAVEQIVKVIKETPLKEHEEMRVKALITIARAGAEQGRIAEARKLLAGVKVLVAALESNENTSEILRDFTVALAGAGDIGGALEQIPKIREPYFVTSALMDLGTFCVAKEVTLSEESVRRLNEIVGAQLPPEIEPHRLINEAGWEIPGLNQATMLRPPELQKTRNRSFALYYTYYTPEVETFIKRPFVSRRKSKPEEAEWESEGLKVSLIEERVINGHKFCYRLTVAEHFHDKSSGLPRYTDYLETIFYYDEDGDGKFETLEEGLDYFARGRIPEWVLEK